MAIATGVAKKLSFKKESAWATNPPGTTGAQYLRRVTSDLGLKKATYASNQIRPDYQKSDFRHGVRSVEGSIDDELSPGTYSLHMAAAMRKDFIAVSNITSLTLTVAAPSNGVQTITRSAGDWMAGNVKVGMGVRVTVGLTANSLNRNLFVVAVSALVMTVLVLAGAALTAEGPIGSCTVAAPGKRTWAPLTGHTDDSFAFEHWFSNIAQSEVYIGNKVQQMDLALPPTGMATIKTSFLGKDIITATAEYFQSVAAATTTTVLAAVNGAMCSQGALIALLTGMTLSIKGNMSFEPVVGSNSPPAIFAGSIDVDGQATVLFQDAVMRDYFLNETDPVSLALVLTGGNSGISDFIALSLPRVKFGDSTKNDGQKGLSMTMPFTALLAADGGTTADHEQTALHIQDSAAV